MKDIKDIVFIVQARLNSERMPQKMIKPFADTNLIELCIDKIKRSKIIPIENFYLSVYESELIEIAKRNNVKIYRRSIQSITDKDITIQKIYEWYKKLPFKYYIMINACLPFLTIETIDDFILSYIKSSCDGMFGVIERKTYYWDKRGKMLNDWPRGKLLDTKIVEPVYEAGHCLYAGTMEQIENGFHMGTFSKKGDPDFYVIKNEKEVFDIDWPWQFKLNEVLYKQGEENV